MIQRRDLINPTNPNWNKDYKISKDPRRLAFVSKSETSITKRNLGGQEVTLNTVRAGLNHGVVYNVVWFLVISLSTFTCCYQTYERFSFFISRPVETRITLIRNLSIKFPSITLCPTYNNYIPLNGLRFQKQQEIGIFFCFIPVFSLLNDKLNITAIWDLMAVNGSFLAFESSRSKMSSGNWLRDMGFSVKTDIKTVFGTCNTYSYENLLQFKKDDFMLHFQFHQNLVLCDPNSMATLMVHNNDDIMTYKAATEGTVQKKATKTVYSLSAKRFKILNRGKKPCDTKRVINECEKNCFEKALKNISLCRLPMTSVPEMPLCANSNDSRDAYHQVMDLAVNFNYLKTCNCPKVCDEILYTEHFKMIEQGTVTRIGFYFGSNVIEEIEEYYSYGFISFICDFGGNLGLFLGLSVPAIFQLAESTVAYTVKKINFIQ